MDTSLNEEVFFGGGGTEYNMKDGIARIYAFSFNENLDTISTINLKSDIKKTMGVTTMKRMDKTDVLFVGTNSSLFVVEYTGSKFTVLNKVENIHSCKTPFLILLTFLSGLINSIDYHDETIYTVSKKD
jgi:hypothetical protein